MFLRSTISEIRTCSPAKTQFVFKLWFYTLSPNMTDVGINWFSSLVCYFFVSFNKQNILKLSSVKYIYQILAIHVDLYKVN